MATVTRTMEFGSLFFWGGDKGSDGVQAKILNVYAMFFSRYTLQSSYQGHIDIYNTHVFCFVT